MVYSIRELWKYGRMIECLVMEQEKSQVELGIDHACYIDLNN